MKDNWEQMAMGQAEIISGLSILCSDLIRELAMYWETDREEEAMQKILSIEDNAEK